MRTLEQLKQLLMNALQGEDYVYYLCQVQEEIVGHGLLDDEDELYYIDVNDDDRLLHYIEYSGIGVWDFLTYGYDANADFINYDFCTLRCSELRDLYLEKLFTDDYEDMLCALFFFDYGDEDESLTELAEELIALEPDEEPEEEAKMDLTPLIMEGLSLFQANEEYKSDYVKILGELLQGISLYMKEHCDGKDQCDFSDKEINVMFYTVFRDMLLEKGDQFCEEYKSSMIDAVLLFHDRVMDDLSEEE